MSVCVMCACVSVMCACVSVSVSVRWQYSIFEHACMYANCVEII